MLFYAKLNYFKITTKLFKGYLTKKKNELNKNNKKRVY